MENRPFSTSERQITTLLNGIKVISEKVKRLIKEMDEIAEHDRRRKEISVAILSHLERLSNLDALQSAHMNNNESHEIAEVIHDSMVEVHNCLALTTATLVLGRIASVRDRALARICSGQCHLGVSRHFTETLDSIDQVILALGVDEHLSDQDKVLIDETRAAVAQLAAIEAATWTLPEFPATAIIPAS